eukprot:9256800-Pyramimonas_sp.AAC.1
MPGGPPGVGGRVGSEGGRSWVRARQGEVGVEASARPVLPQRPGAPTSCCCNGCRHFTVHSASVEV